MATDCSCVLMFDGISKLAEQIQTSQPIKSLQLRIKMCNNFGLQGIEELSQLLMKMTDLSQFSLFIEPLNSIDTRAAINLGILLKPLINLTQLQIYVCSESNLEFGDQIYQKQYKHKLGQQLNEGNANIIRSRGVEGLFEGIKHLRCLSELSVSIGSNNEIDEQGSGYIKEGLSDLKYLQQLELHIGRSNTIGNRGIYCISIGIGNLPQLQSLSLSIGKENNITEEEDSIHTLAQSIQRLTSLTALRLHIHEQLNFSCTNSLYQGIRHLTNLTALDIYIPQYRNVQMMSLLLYLEHLIPEHTVFSNDVNLLFIRSHISCDDITQNQLTQLTIWIDEQRIDHIGMKYLGYALKKLSSLQSFKIVILENRILSAGTIAFFQGVKHLTNLTDFRICIENCCIGQQGLHSLAESLRHLVNLSSLSIKLFNNELSIESIKTLGKHFIHLSQLKQLVIDIEGIQTEQTLANQSPFVISQLDSSEQQVLILGQQLKYLVNLRFIQVRIVNKEGVDQSRVLRIGEGMKDISGIEEMCLSLSLYDIDCESISEVTADKLEHLKMAITIDNYLFKQPRLGEWIQRFSQLQILCISFSVSYEYICDIKSVLEQTPHYKTSTHPILQQLAQNISTLLFLHQIQIEFISTRASFHNHFAVYNYDLIVKNYPNLLSPYAFMKLKRLVQFSLHLKEIDPNDKYH